MSSKILTFCSQEQCERCHSLELFTALSLSDMNPKEVTSRVRRRLRVLATTPSHSLLCSGLRSLDTHTAGNTRNSLLSPRCHDFLLIRVLHFSSFVSFQDYYFHFFLWCSFSKLTSLSFNLLLAENTQTFTSVLARL